MVIEDYKSNSHKSKEPVKEERKVTPVVSRETKIVKKTRATKFKDVFIAKDIKSVFAYIGTDILVPAMKKLIVDSVKNGVDLMVNGDVRRSQSGDRFSSGNISRIAYDRSYRSDRDYSYDSRIRTGYDFDDIEFRDRADAEKVLDSMDDAIERYRQVSVADFYEFANLPSNHTDFKYGWTDLRSAKIIPTRDGYVIKLPKATVLD